MIVKLQTSWMFVDSSTVWLLSHSVAVSAKQLGAAPRSVSVEGDRAPWPCPSCPPPPARSRRGPASPSLGRMPTSSPPRTGSCRSPGQDSRSLQCRHPPAEPRSKTHFRKCQQKVSTLIILRYNNLWTFFHFVKTLFIGILFPEKECLSEVSECLLQTHWKD